MFHSFSLCQFPVGFGVIPYGELNEDLSSYLPYLFPDSITKYMNNTNPTTASHKWTMGTLAALTATIVFAITSFTTNAS